MLQAFGPLFCFKLRSKSWLWFWTFLLLVVTLSTVITDALAKSRDFYRILGVPRTATTEQIKKRYRELSRQYHPDSNPNASPQKFIDIRDAHEVLAKQDTREIYDRYGEEGLSEGGGGGRPDHGGGHFFTQNGQTFYFTGGGHPFHQFFEHGEGFGFGGGGRKYKDLFASDSSAVMKLSASNWDAAVGEREFAVLVNFYNPGCSHCVEFESGYEDLAKSYKDVIQIAAVNCRESNRLCTQLDITKLPTFLLFGAAGRGDNDPLKYSGEVSEIAIKKWLSNNVPVGGTILTTNNFESWLTSNANIPKVIYFADKSVVPLLIRAVFHEFKTKIAMGCVLLGTSSGQALKRDKFKHWGTEAPTFPALLHITDIDKLTGENIPLRSQSKTVLSLILSRILTQKRTGLGGYSTEKAFKELTKRRFNSGECGPQDGDICILLLHAGPLPASSPLLKAGEDVAAKFVKDPVKMYWVDAFQQKGFAAAFGFMPELEGCKPVKQSCGTAAQGKSEQCQEPHQRGECFSVVGFRPKRKKFKKLVHHFKPSCSQDDILNRLETFTDSILNGGSPLTEKLSGSLSFL